MTVGTSVLATSTLMPLTLFPEPVIVVVPAPFAALQAVQAGYEKGREAGYRAEARAFGEMAVSE